MPKKFQQVTRYRGFTIYVAPVKGCCFGFVNSSELVKVVLSPKGSQNFPTVEAAKEFINHFLAQEWSNPQPKHRHIKVE